MFQVASIKTMFDKHSSCFMANTATPYLSKGTGNEIQGLRCYKI